MTTDLVTRLLLQNQEFDRNLKVSQNQIKSFQKRVDLMGASVRSFVTGFAGMAGVSFAFMDITQKSIQFEKSLSSLRSLTGVSAEELSFFKDEAIKLGSTSTQTASQVVEAFQLIGSQKPELLKSKDALAEVTKNAITLAEAAGMDVPEAAKALTGSLNQMGESSRSAGEYINILAAASQAGSADIPYLTKAIEKSGGAASTVGIKYNELVAVIETIAPKITEASEAGTNLRNIFLILESSSDKNLKPSVVGLSKSIENLAAKNYDATQMTKLFGRESVTAALALVSAKDDYNRYVEAITGTNTAIEQQKINNDNLAGSINAVSSAWEGFVLTLNNSNGALKESANLFAAMISRMTEAVKSEEQIQQETVQKAVSNEIKNMDRLIKSWEDYGDSRAEAISKSIDLQEKDNGGGVGISNKLKTEETELKNIEDRIKILTEKGKGYNKRSYQEGVELDDLRSQKETQKEIVNQLQLKNAVYRESIQYLKNQLQLTNEIKENTNPKSTNVLSEAEKKRRNNEQQDINAVKYWTSDQIQKMAFPEPVSIPVVLTEKDIEKELERINDLAENKGKSIKLELSEEELENLRIKVATKIHVPVIPKLIEPEDDLDVSDTTGSISDYQKKIQTVTLAYNEATTDGLRALYAKQREDLEKHLEEMTDMNQGMIDISNELQSLIQSGVVSGFESLGEAIGSGDPAEAMRNMLMGLMDMLKQFGAALVAAGMAKIAFDKLLANPYAAIAAGGALIIATSVAKSALQKSVSAGDYAEGGTVPYFTVGDRMTANVNGGEMILNTGQQAKLFDLLDLGRSQVENNRLEVTGRLVGEGSNLYAVLDTYAKKQRRGR